MRPLSLIAGLLLLTVGIVWTGQGANLIAGSFMTGQRMWLVIGLIVALAGAVLLWRGLIRPRS